MPHAVTVYHHTESFESGQDEYALESFPRAVMQVMDGDNLRRAVEDGLRKIHDGKKPSSFDHAALLCFADPEQASVPKVWYASSQYWGVAGDGRLLVAGWDLGKMTVGDLRRGSESGYVDAAWDHIVVLDPEGLGGPGDLASPFTEFLGNVGVELAVGAVTAPLLAVARKVRRIQRDRRVKRVIAGWHRQGIDGPWILTRWVDTKTTWPADEVAKRLAITRHEAESLLKAMGYEYSDRLQAWTVGTTEKAIMRRKRWDRNEVKEWQRPRRP